MSSVGRSNCRCSPQKFPELKGTYLGQTPPGNEPKLFAPDIISTASGNEPDNHGGLTFTPDGKEIYCDLRQKIWMIKMKKDRWTKPEVAPFSYRQDDKYSDDSACLTPDGKKLFFISTRTGAVSENKENIWFVERTESGWSEPKPVHPEVNALQIRVI